MSDLNNPLEQLERMRSAFALTQSRVGEVQERLAALSVEREDEEGRLGVTVDHTGVTGIHIDPRAMRMASQDISEGLLALIRAATDELQAQTRAITDELVRDVRVPEPDLDR